MKKIILCTMILFLSLNYGCANDEIQNFDKIPFDNTGMTKADLSDYLLINDESYVYEMTYEELAIFGDSGIIFIGYPECFWCNQAMPVFNYLAKNEIDIPFYYLKVDVPMKESDYNLILDSYRIVNPEADEIHTPLVIGIKYGEVVGAEQGTVSFDVEKQQYFNDEQISEQIDIYNVIVKAVRG